MEMRNRMYKHENIAEIKILLNPFSCDFKKKRKQHRAANPPPMQPPLLLPATLRRRMLRERVINLKAKVAHSYTSLCTEEGLGFWLSRFCP